MYVPSSVPSLPLRIALDLSPLSRPFPLGVQRVVRSALAALELRGDLEIVKISPPAGASLARWRQTGLVQEAREARAEVLHSWTSAFPLRAPMPVVQTVHEAPWRHGARENAGSIHQLWARLGRVRAALVVTPSARVARDLGEHRKLRVVPWAVDAAFFQDLDAGPSIDSQAKLLAALPGLPRGAFVLCLGGTRPKKRLDLVLEAAASLGTPVICTGPETPEALALAAIHPHLILAGVVADALLPALIRAAGCVAILSTSEGFGLPALEALAVGTPVVVPVDSVQAETSAGFGIEVDPKVPGAIEAGIAEALACPANGPRRTEGSAHAATFTWERTADALASHWRTLL